jgi:hypothetical protein
MICARRPFSGCLTTDKYPLDGATRVAAVHPHPNPFDIDNSSGPGELSAPGPAESLSRGAADSGLNRLLYQIRAVTLPTRP